MCNRAGGREGSCPYQLLQSEVGNLDRVGKTHKLEILLTVLFWDHASGADRFSRFLITWHKFFGSLACSAYGNDRFKKCGAELAPASITTVSNDDRSALVFAVASCVYTFMQDQVKYAVPNLFSKS